MSDYPALTEMGIFNFGEISSYTLRQDGANHDVLRINYKRPKGSLLAISRKYRFGRAPKGVIGEEPDRETKQVYEISPFLLRAVSELDSLVRKEKNQKDKKTRLLADIEHLEELVSDKIASIRAEIDKL